MFNNRKIAIAIAIGLVVVIAIVGIFATQIIKKDNIQLFVSPQDASIKIGDTNLQSGKTAYIAPGTYKLSINADNFTSITKDVTITDTFKSMSFCLYPKNMTPEEYFKTHDQDRYICEGAAGEAYKEETSAAIAKYPILEKLPYEDGVFSVGQGVLENHSGPAIYVHYIDEKTRLEALDWIHRNSSPNQLPPIISTNDYEQTDRIGGKDSQIDKILIQKYPIIKTLPTDASIYKLGYRIDESNPNGHSIKLTIKSDTASGRIAALREIYALGYKATDYKIEFINFEGSIKK